MAETAPRPWRVARSHGGLVGVYDAHNAPVAFCPEFTWADEAVEALGLIVHRVNAYDDLVAAADHAENTLTLLTQDGQDVCMDAPRPEARCFECLGCSIYMAVLSLRAALRKTRSEAVEA